MIEIYKYNKIHRWLNKLFGKANKCENPECLHKSTTFQWAKLKGCEYERKRENFWMLCQSCHSKYDKKKFYVDDITKKKIGDKNKISIRLKWQDPEYRKMMIAAQIGHIVSETTRRKIGLANRKNKI